MSAVVAAPCVACNECGWQVTHSSKQGQPPQRVAEVEPIQWKGNLVGGQNSSPKRKPKQYWLQVAGQPSGQGRALNEPDLINTANIEVISDVKGSVHVLL